MKVWLWLFCAVYVAGLVVLLRVARGHRRWYTLAKGALSALFLLGAVLAWITGSRQHTSVFYLLLAALVLCAAGDVLLGLANSGLFSKKRRKQPPAAAAGSVDASPAGEASGKAGVSSHPAPSRKPFLFGAGCFSLAHVLYCVLFYGFAPFTWFDGVLPLVLVLVVLWLEHSGRVRLRKMKPVAVVYTFLVGLMATKAAQVGIAAGFVAGSVLLTVGSALFLISDVVLLFLYFGTRRHRIFRGLNLTSYYLGVGMMALSVHWL